MKVIAVHGDLDSLGVRMVEERFNSAISDRASRLAIDLTSVGFLSSAGLALLLVKGKILRRGGGNLVIAGPNPHVMEVLTMAGFQELFEVYPTLPEALAALGRG